MTFNHQKSNWTRDGGKKRQSHKLSDIIGSKERQSDIYDDDMMIAIVARKSSSEASRSIVS